MTKVIPIKTDNGYPECPSCAWLESGTCEFCDEADQYEEAEQDSLELQRVYA